jgi:hypothetical protein
LNTLYAATAVIEVGAGLALLCAPSAAAALLLGRPLAAPAALTVARIGGAGLLTLGVACWLAGGDMRSLAAKALVTAMVIYNLGVALILGLPVAAGRRRFVAGGRAAHGHDHLVRHEPFGMGIQRDRSPRALSKVTNVITKTLDDKVRSIKG